MGILQATQDWIAKPPPGDLPNPGIEPRSPALQVDSLPSEPPGKSPNLQMLKLLPWWLSDKESTLPMLETWVLSLVWEDRTCLGATEPRCHSY